jgi:hypothetical protein
MSGINDERELSERLNLRTEKHRLDILSHPMRRKSTHTNESKNILRD